MATIQVNSIVNRAATLIQDATNVRWPTSELIDWLNDGQREIVLIKPQASVKNESKMLDASATKQTIPSNGVMLIDVVRNMGANGSTPGNAIRPVSREVLDAQRPSWHSDANAGSIQHFMFDPRDPKTFYIYPKAPATAWYVELIYSASPTDVDVPVTTSTSTITYPAAHNLSAGSTVSFSSINGLSGVQTGTVYYVLSTPSSTTATIGATSGGSAITLGTGSARICGTIQIDDVYANALLDYVLYRAYSKDADYAGNAQLAVSHYQAFSNSLGVKKQNEIEQNPNLTFAGFNPNVIGSAKP